MRSVLIVLLSLQLLLGVDITLESNEENQTIVMDVKRSVFFGQRLFQGKFKENKQLLHNPDYLLNTGDEVSIKLWGAYTYEAKLTVDKEGNIFIPRVGLVYLLGVSNRNVISKIKQALKRTFNKNVSVYASLNNYQPISIFVTGGVNTPGLYQGLSSDSVLQLLDKAGGIINAEGSYRNITILRANRVIKYIDLYSFLLDGQLALFQFKNGDVIKVGLMKDIIEITGEVNHPYIFELNQKRVLVQEITRHITPKANATHFIITRWQNGLEKVEKYPLIESRKVYINSGEKINFISDHYRDNIMVNIMGEHGGLKTVTVPKGTSLKSVIAQIISTPISDESGVQLFRKSIAKRQKQLIQANLKDLEARVLTTGSSTTEEAKIRKEESALVLDFIKRASTIKPKGQVVINSESNLSLVMLEEGDVIYIPKKTQIVVVEGEVSLPNAQTFVAQYSIEDYIKSCGGYSPRANMKKVLLVKKNGKVLTYDASGWWADSAPNIEAGDSILVLGKIDSKNIQITSSVTQILYQVAVGAAVVLRAF